MGAAIILEPTQHGLITLSVLQRYLEVATYPESIIFSVATSNKAVITIKEKDMLPILACSSSTENFGFMQITNNKPNVNIESSSVNLAIINVTNIRPTLHISSNNNSNNTFVNSILPIKEFEFDPSVIFGTVDNANISDITKPFYDINDDIFISGKFDTTSYVKVTVDIPGTLNATNTLYLRLFKNSLDYLGNPISGEGQDVSAYISVYTVLPDDSLSLIHYTEELISITPQNFEFSILAEYSRLIITLDFRISLVLDETARAICASMVKVMCEEPSVELDKIGNDTVNYISNAKSIWCHAPTFLGYNNRFIITFKGIKYTDFLEMGLYSGGGWQTGLAELFSSGEFIPITKSTCWAFKFTFVNLLIDDILEIVIFGSSITHTVKAGENATDISYSLEQSLLTNGYSASSDNEFIFIKGVVGQLAIENNKFSFKRTTPEALRL